MRQTHKSWACFNGIDDDGDGMAISRVIQGVRRAVTRMSGIGIPPQCSNERDDDGDGLKISQMIPAASLRWTEDSVSSKKVTRVCLSPTPPLAPFNDAPMRCWSAIVLAEWQAFNGAGLPS